MPMRFTKVTQGLKILSKIATPDREYGRLHGTGARRAMCVIGLCDLVFFRTALLNSHLGLLSAEKCKVVERGILSQP